MNQYPYTHLFLLIAIQILCSCSHWFENHVIQQYGEPTHGWVKPVGDLPQNPTTANVSSVNNGKQLFEHHCSRCHGVDGKGMQLTATRRSSDLGIAVSKHPDGFLFLQISAGRDGMPIWSKDLSDQDLWDIINYLKQLNPPS